MRSLTAAIVLLLLAGCLERSSLSPEPSPSEAERSVAELFQQRTLVGAGGDAETSHFVSPDGQTILACSHGGFTQPSPLWVSEDGGATFRRLSPTPSPPVGGDCDVVITADGSWYMVYDTLVSISVTGTSDKGATWRFAYVTDPLLTNVDRPWIQAVGNTLYITFADLMATQPIVLMFSKSGDGGRTWTAPVVVTGPPSVDETNCWVGRMVTREDGSTIRIPVNCWSPSDAGDEPQSIYLATSGDAGETWELGSPVAQGIGVPTAAYAPDGTLWLSYVLPEGSARQIEARYLAPTTTTFSEPVIITRLGTDAFDWPWIDARPDGSATVAWMNRTGARDPRGFQPVVARILQESNTPLFVGPIADVWNGTTTFEFFMVKHDDKGVAHVVYPLGGANCKVSPPVTGTASDRNDLCVHFVKETLQG